MSVTVTFEGLNELKAALRSLPEDLAHEAAGVIEDTARGVGSELQSHYPVGPTGNLRRRVRVDVQRARFGVSAKVRSQAPHAGIYESGTAQRRTGRGFNRGRMPQAPEESRLIPRAIRARKQMTKALIAIVEKHGGEVNES